MAAPGQAQAVDTRHGCAEPQLIACPVWRSQLISIVCNLQDRARPISWATQSGHKFTGTWLTQGRCKAPMESGPGRTGANRSCAGPGSRGWPCRYISQAARGREWSESEPEARERSASDTFICGASVRELSACTILDEPCLRSPIDPRVGYDDTTIEHKSV
jgi:hypothetical protein